MLFLAVSVTFFGWVLLNELGRRKAAEVLGCRLAETSLSLGGAVASAALWQWMIADLILVIAAAVLGGVPATISIPVAAMFFFLRIGILFWRETDEPVGRLSCSFCVALLYLGTWLTFAAGVKRLL